MLKPSLAAMAAAFLAFCAAQAGPYENLSAAMANCAAVKGETAQLACYNRIAAQLKSAAQAQMSAAPSAPSVPAAAAAAPAPAAPVIAAAPVPQAATPAQEAKQEESHWYDVGSWFGSSDKPPPARPVTGTPTEFGADNWRLQAATNAPEPLDHITAAVKDVRYSYFRHFTVTLDNGQVWRQVEADTRVARFDEDKPQSVTIKRGFMGAFTLSIEGQWGNFQVTRIK